MRARAARRASRSRSARVSADTSIGKTASINMRPTARVKSLAFPALASTTIPRSSSG